MPPLSHALLLLFLFGVASATRAESLDHILACNAEALGGERAFEQIDNLRIQLDIAEPEFEVTATYVASRAGLMRIDVMAGDERVFAEGLDEAGAWQWTPDAGVTRSSAAAAATLRHGVEAPGRFSTLRHLQLRGARVEWLQPGPLSRPEEWQLQLTRDDGTQTDHFLARASCLPTREVSRRAFHPDVDATEVLIETVHSGPAEIDGVLRFQRGESRSLATGEWLGTTQIRGMEHNVELPDRFFEAR